MKKYFYCAKDYSGKTFKGNIFAESSDEAAEILRSQKYFLLELKREKKYFQQYFQRYFLYKIKQNDIAIFCRQLSIMLQSGITLKESLDVINTQMKNKKFKNILYEISLQIQTGKNFSDSLIMYRNFFPQSFLALVTVGEASGRLEDVLKKAAEYLERDYTAKEKLKTAAIYPLILILIFFSTACIMFMVVLPIFADLLKNLQIELPFLTRIVLFVGNILKEYSILTGVSFVVLIIIFRLFWQQEKYQVAAYKFFLKIPLFGRLLSELLLLQFCNELAVMLSAGLTIDKSIAIIVDNAPNILIRKILQRTRADIKKGCALSASLSGESFFPPLFMQMLMTGEKSGNLALMMELTAVFYQNDVDLLYKRSIAFVEPCMIVIISIFIGIFVAAVAMPMFEAVSYVPS